MLKTTHGSKNLLQRAILYRHEKILVGRGRRLAKTSETIYDIWSVFHPYLWIAVFVWARAVCGARYICVVLQWIPTGRLGKSLGQRLGYVKVPRLMTKFKNFMV